MKYALVNCTILSLMKETTIDSELQDEDFYGYKVEILSRPIPGWYEIRTHYNYIGLVQESDLLLEEEKIHSWDNAYKMIVIQSYADVLSMPKVQGHHMISLTRGALLSVIAQADENGWVKVGLCDGREGYIKEKFLGEYITTWDPCNEEWLRYQVVNAALSYLGTQYRWGGKSPLGIDCSGLCSVAYMLNGVMIYRDAQIKEGFPVHEIAYEDMKPGDLLFFPGHVAMYIGNDKYVHSTGKNGSDGVVINSLNPSDEDYREDLPKVLKAVGSIF